MKLNRASYEILEKTISLYLSYDDIEEEDIIIRIIGDRIGNISNLEEYLNFPHQNKLNYYKVMVLIKSSSRIDNYYIPLSREELLENIKETSNSRFNEVINKIFLPIPIINSISNTGYNGFDDMGEDKIDAYYDKIIYTYGNLITYIVNHLLENINIVKEDNTNNKDDKQLCLKI